MKMRKHINILWWNKFEFMMYLSLGVGLPVIIFFFTGTRFDKLFDQDYQNIFTISTVLFSIFIGIGLTRFFDKVKEVEQVISTLKMLLSSVRVWTIGIDTLTQRWSSQLDWLDVQLSGRIATVNILLPHKLHSIELPLILELPDKFGSISLLKLKHSLISANHKIDANLNFILEKIHLRDKLSEQEINEIKGLLKNHSTSVLSTLRKEFPKIECEIEKILLKLGANNDR